MSTDWTGRRSAFDVEGAWKPRETGAMRKHLGNRVPGSVSACSRPRRSPTEAKHSGPTSIGHAMSGRGSLRAAGMAADGKCPAGRWRLEGFGGR